MALIFSSYFFLLCFLQFGFKIGSVRSTHRDNKLTERLNIRSARSDRNWLQGSAEASEVRTKKGPIKLYCTIAHV